MGVVGDLMAARMSQFRDIVAVELPQLFDALHFDAATREALQGHARNLENWLAGILNWHQGCRRYAEADLIANMRPARPELFRSPAGLGSSAARILRTLQVAR
jgi:germacradienol/geosmin synthase